jgi:ADP-ribose pyrophosphatase
MEGNMTSDSLEEKTLESKLIYDGRVVHLHLDTVQLPNGKTALREVVRHNGAVAVVPIDRDGNVILVQQYRHPAGRVLLEIPAGTLYVGEDPDICVERELQEETGYKPGKIIRLGGIFLAPGYSTEYIHLYLATDLVESRLDMDEDEFIEVERLPLAEIYQRIAHGEIADSKTICAMTLARQHLPNQT